MKKIILMYAAALFPLYAAAQAVTLNVSNRPAAEVFGKIMNQTGKNFIYESSLLKGKTITVHAKSEKLDTVLSDIFRNSNIGWRIDGNNVILYERVKETKEKNALKNASVSGYVRESGSEEPLVGVVVTFGKARGVTNYAGYYSVTVPIGKITAYADYPGFSPYESGPFDVKGNTIFNILLSPATELEEVVVSTTPNQNITMHTGDIGHFNMTRETVMSTPALFSEPDIVKTLQLLPGVAAGTEGLAGMLVHGGGSDENLYMLDNVPLYQINHFGGLFSAFNAEAVKNVDFHKTSFPTRYDGRLSSFMDVTTKEGNMERHHGSFRLGLTSGQFNIDGPIAKGKTSYSLALRRSWLDVITIPAFALANKGNPDKNSFRYAFTDLNAKITHRFSEGSTAHLMFYYGNDELKGKSDWNLENQFRDKDTESLVWGNMLLKGGWNKEMHNVFGRFSLSWSRYKSTIGSDIESTDYNKEGSVKSYRREQAHSLNQINDLSARADFSWQPGSHHVEFGGSYTFHSYVPQKIWRKNVFGSSVVEGQHNELTLHAGEASAYIGDDWDISSSLRVSAGLNTSAYILEGDIRKGVSPRLSARWSPFDDKWSFKVAYSRTVQYVHQLAETYISLPTDRWVPLTKGSPAQTADKIGAGAYWNFKTGWTASVEGWWKWSHNIVDFFDDYYLIPTDTGWSNQLTRGNGEAKGVDVMVLKEGGRLTGHVSYSLMWADKTFASKNGGVSFPATNDNRHKINIRLDWNISSKWSLGAAWTGMSGNRYTLPTMIWSTPELPGYTDWFAEPSPVFGKINNYRLPFYHRLDLGARKNTKHGYWTISIYNAYCNMNPIAVKRSYEVRSEWIDSGSGKWDEGEIKTVNRSKFQYIRLFPIIPSFSYTWLF